MGEWAEHRHSDDTGNKGLFGHWGGVLCDAQSTDCRRDGTNLSVSDATPAYYTPGSPDFDGNHLGGYKEDYWYPSTQYREIDTL